MYVLGWNNVWGDQDMAEKEVGEEKKNVMMMGDFFGLENKMVAGGFEHSVSGCDPIDAH